MKEITKVNM